MPVSDHQGELSQVGKGAWDGLPPSGFKMETVTDEPPNGGTATNEGPFSTDRTKEP